jgi:hypothetical protein
MRKALSSDKFYPCQKQAQAVFLINAHGWPKPKDEDRSEH